MNRPSLRHASNQATVSAATVSSATMYSTLLSAIRYAATFAAAACLAGPAFATDVTDATDGWVPVGEHMLAEARGGFDTGNGLLVSLSVDRVLSLNGNVVASGQLSMDAAALASNPGLSTVQIARIGEGSALVQAARPLAGLVLQNSANDQLIRSQTTIDATVNSLSLLKDLNFGDSLRQSLSTAIGPR